MKRLILLIIVGSMLLPLRAQNQAKMVVLHFQLDELDNAANREGTMKKDQNGTLAALLKIETSLDGLSFGGGTLGIVDTEKKAESGEYWVYIPERSRELTITSKKYGNCTFEYPVEIESARTYKMKVVIEGMNITLRTTVEKSTIIIDEDTVGESPLTEYLSYGVHTVKARKASMICDSTVVVRKDGNDDILLRMFDENDLYGEITIKVENGADIYFEDKKVGTGSVSMRLRGDQTYVVTTRKANCDDNNTSFTVKPKERKVVIANAPIPHTGILRITSIPSSVNMYDDNGRLLSTDNVCTLPIGNNTITFRRDKYKDYTETYNIRRNEETRGNIKMKPVTYIKRNGVYFGAAYTYNTLMGASIIGGFSIYNVDLQISYTLGFAESEEVNWYSAGDNVYDETCTYKSDEFAVKLGYQLTLGERLALVPQVGYLAQILKSSGSRGDGAVCGCVTLGAKLIYSPVQHLYIYVSPEYALAVQKSDTYAAISDIGDFSEGGLYAHVGVLVNF